MGGGKSIVAAIVVGGLIVMLAGGAYIAFLRRSMRERETQVPVQANAVGTPSDVARAPVEQDAAQPRNPDPATPVADRTAQLTELLARYKAWSEGRHVEGRRRPDETPAEWKERVGRALAEGPRVLEGSRELIFAEPETFLAFVADPANQACVSTLLSDALGDPTEADMGRQNYHAFPETLMSGLVTILRIGTRPQKDALMTFLSMIVDQPATHLEHYLALLPEGSRDFQRFAMSAIRNSSIHMNAATFQGVRRIYESASDPSLRDNALVALVRSNVPEAEPWLLERLESAEDPKLVSLFANGLSQRLAFANAGHGVVDNPARCARAVTVAATRRSDAHAFEGLVLAALNLPAPFSRSAMEDMLPHAPTSSTQEAMSAVVDRMRQGEADRVALISAFMAKIRGR